MFNARCFFAFTKTAENNQAAISCKLFTVISSVLQDDNLIQLRSALALSLASSNSCELQSLHCISGSDDELSLETSVYVFSFSFSEESLMEIS